MRLEKLPSSLGALKLQSLDISYSKLYDLPDSIYEMTTLTELVVVSAKDKVFLKASDIRKHLNLPEVIVHTVHQTENKECSSIVELEQLTCKELQVLQLQNVKHPEDAERAKLRDKTDLLRLYLSFGLQGEDDKSVQCGSMYSYCTCLKLVVLNILFCTKLVIS
jgi:aquaporin TIP